MGVGYRWAQAQVCPGQSGGRRGRELPWGLTQGSPEVAAGEGSTGQGQRSQGSGPRDDGTLSHALRSWLGRFRFKNGAR